MKKKRLVLGLVMALLVALAGCGSSFPAAGDAGGALPSSSEATSQESVPEEPESEPAPEPEEETPTEKATSIYLYQETLSYAGFTPVWELTIEDEEELTLVEGLLSPENLMPLSQEEASWPDGGSPILFVIYYESNTIDGACNPKYIDSPSYSELGRTILRADGTFYGHPREMGEVLLAFLEDKGIEVQY